MKTVNLLLILSILIYTGCSIRENKTEIQKLYGEKINAINDTIPVPFAISMVSYNNNLYISDFNNGRLMILDSALHLVRTIGKGGADMGEFQGLTYFAVSQDTLYLVNDGNQKLNVFLTNGSYIRETTISEVQPVFNRFSVIGNNILVAAFNADKPIVKCNFEGGLLNTFGTFYPSANLKQGRARNDRFLINGSNNELISISKGEAIIERFSERGELIEKIDLSNNPYLKSRLQFNSEANKNKDNAYATYMLFQDVYYHNNKLYFLFIDQQLGGPVCHQVLVLNNFEGDKSIDIFELKNKNEKYWYTTFCVYNNFIYTFEKEAGELLRFKLS